jgi:DNA-binding response OmpR family regulator
MSTPPAEAQEVLVAEHEPAVAELIRRYLVREGLRVRSAATPQETMAALAGRPAAAVVLDLTMPGLDAREIRKLVGKPPGGRRDAPRVICLTAGGGPHTAHGLRAKDIGISQDACLPRPFGPRALVSLVRDSARAARAAQAPAAGPYTAGRLRIEPGPRRASVAGTQVDLTGTEFDLLSCLARSAGRAVPRDRLRREVWGKRGMQSERVTDVYIAQLRAKLGPRHGIRTVRGIGYVLDPDTLEPAPPAGGSQAPATIGGAGHPIRGDSGTA